MKKAGRYKVEIELHNGKKDIQYFNQREKMIDYVSRMKYYGFNEIQVYIKKYETINIEKEIKYWNPEKKRFELV